MPKALRTSFMYSLLTTDAQRDPPPLAPTRRDRPSRTSATKERPKPVTSRPSTPRESEAATWAALLIRIRDDRDEAAFATLFRHFAPRLKGFLMRSGADATEAEECAQEVMTTLWVKAAQFDPARASAATWLFTIARNKRIDRIRRQRRPEPEDLPWGPEPDPDQASLLGLQQETEQLAAAMNALPEKQRDLIQKAYFGDMTHSEIADATGLPLGTIKSRLRLALDRLRHAMTTRDQS